MTVSKRFRLRVAKLIIRKYRPSYSPNRLNPISLSRSSHRVPLVEGTSQVCRLHRELTTKDKSSLKKMRMATSMAHLRKEKKWRILSLAVDSQTSIKTQDSELQKALSPILLSSYNLHRVLNNGCKTTPSKFSKLSFNHLLKTQ